ncbi:hypothetical protein SS1G_09359 [Sclerotinia sclerotiorum 1980 UF-70]|uniref:Autophagy-related protein 29 n=2 Tax=Sclerotinia sclerotiorum (strain ATCC 18683 / 1980 / Ss-1) TaxID=665079 RepID=A7EVK0_SCLS1|nr:hypothetical protein SS1G_09359 [Sclerotinia sclerotiorum 1980 UF-70]APA15790.1 hypothetical protein sscle_15g105600 [Sclerotinia sclerotiorum 1980 UF-70]EDN93492.1 hypothetical protein SS1G_09359 [Sclerotinia sclerotiorum 1980 UF-70]
MSNPDPEPDPSYTVFIRLPFPRGDFVDPPDVEWDAAKDKALWKILSKASKNSDVDWAALATKFEVTLAFLLQQAAWLYERQLSQVRAQMRKVTVSKGSLAPSPVPGSTSETTGGEGMKRTGSGGGGPRIQSSLSNRKETSLSKTDGSVPDTPNRAMAPRVSRTSSRDTTIQSRTFSPTSPRPSHATIERRALSPKPRSRPASMAIDHPTRNSPQQAQLSSPEDSSDDDAFQFQSRLLYRRFPSSKKKTQGPSSDDDEPAFLRTSHDPSATLRGDPRNISRRTPVLTKKPIPIESQTSDSSTSSTAQIVNKRHDAVSGGGRRPPSGPLSPRRTAELQSERSDGGTPSMGSSFSDLDDASVTQSALEEALASNMQAGGMASRMSTISQALRSRYL